MKRFFALSVSVVSLACASCGGAIETDPTQTTNPSPTSTGRTTPKRPPGPSSSSSSGGFGDIDCPQNTPLTPADLDQEIGWKPSKAVNGSCTATDLAKLEQNFKDTSLRTYFDLAKGLSSACRACAFSKDTDPTWGVIVGTAESNGESGFVNYGACFSVLESSACGQAVQYERFCGEVACADCSTTSSELSKCVGTATDGGMCKDFHATTTAQCPNLAANLSSCGDILKSVKTICGGS